MSGEANKKHSIWFFEGPSSKGDVRTWWQERRLRYNCDLFLVGVVSWTLVLVAGSAAVKTGEDFLDTISLRGTPRRHLFKAGYVVSLIVTALPGMWAVVAWGMTVVTGQKL